MTLSVLVKGNRFQAARAMAAAGIPFAFQRETGKPYQETVGLVGDQFLELVRETFHKDDAARDAIRLPVGAILLWTFITDTPDARIYTSDPDIAKDETK